MKPFEIKEYLRLKEEGKEPRIVTRDGHSARIVCTDVKNEYYPVLALFTNDCGEEKSFNCTTYGRCDLSAEYRFDLFFADPEPTYRPYKNAEECFKDVIKHGGWVKRWGIEYHNILCVSEYYVHFSGMGDHFDEFLDNNVWADDGTPCGVKEE